MSFNLSHRVIAEPFDLLLSFLIWGLALIRGLTWLTSAHVPSRHKIRVGISIACSGAAGAHALMTGKTARSWGVSIVSHTDAHFPKLAHALGMVLVKSVVRALPGTGALPPTGVHR